MFLSGSSEICLSITHSSLPILRELERRSLSQRIWNTWGLLLYSAKAFASLFLDTRPTQLALSLNMFSMACSSWLQFSSASCQHQTNALLLFLTCSPALQHYCHWHCSSETCCCYIPITVSHNIPLIPIPQSCSHSQCPCSTSAS